jgi:hypothetical protein
MWAVERRLREVVVVGGSGDEVVVVVEIVMRSHITPVTNL